MSVRVTQKAVESSLQPSTAGVRVTQKAIESSLQPTGTTTGGKVRVTQKAVEVSLQGSGSQSGGPPPPGSVHVTQIAVEVSLNPNIIVPVSGGNFQDAFGNPIAFGTLEVWLNSDAQSPTGLIAAGVRQSVTLDAGGFVVANTLSLWPNALLQMSAPNVYWAKVTSADGKYSWRTTFVVPVGSPYDITTSIPNEYNGMGANLAAAPSGPSVTVNPSAVQLFKNAQQQFTATVSGLLNTQVGWQVDGNPGGNAGAGLVDATGLYTAPTSAGDHSLTAVAVAAPTVSGSALVSVQDSVIAVTVTPSSATVQQGTQQQFTASISGTGILGVTWSVDGIAGGNGTVGTIDANGVYTAPSSPGNHTVTATSIDDVTKSGNSSVSVTTVPVSVAILPQTVTNLRWGATQQFTVTVTGTGNTAVNWLVDNLAGGNSTVGTISVTGLYTAPSGNGTHTITAQSQADTSKSDSATVTVASGISVAISPLSPSVIVLKTLQFTATVTGTVLTGVTWAVDNIVGGNSTVGTISASGLYTAPSAVGVHTIKATSTTDNTKSASTQVSVDAAVITVTVTPATASINGGQTSTFTAVVTGTSNQAVTWYVDGIQGGNATVGTISTIGVYTASLVKGTHTIKAVANVNNTSFATASVTVSLSVNVSILPTTASLLVSQTQKYTATVTGALNTAVNWFVNNIAGGNGTVGTIDSTGLYTAPASVSVTTTFTIKAQSQADTTVSSTASVTVSLQAAIVAVPSDYVVACCIGPGQGFGRFPSVGNEYSDRLWDAGMDYFLTATSPFSTFSTALDKWHQYFGISVTDKVTGGSFTRKAVVTLCGRNAWAKFNSNGKWTSAFLTNTWTPFIQSLCNTYGAGKTKDATGWIEAFEIWNEGDAGNNTGIPSGNSATCVGNWIALAKIAAPLLRAAGFKTCGPAPQSSQHDNTGFLYQLGVQGGGQYLDVITRHHYRTMPETTAGYLKAEIQLVQQFTDLVNKDWWVTEANAPQEVELGEDAAVAYVQRLYILSWMFGQTTAGKQLLKRLYFWTYDSQNGTGASGTNPGEPVLLCNNKGDTFYPSAPNGGENCVAKAWGAVDGTTTSGKAFSGLQKHLVGCQFLSYTLVGTVYTVNVTFKDGTSGTITWDSKDLTNANAIPVFSNNVNTVNVHYRSGTLGPSYFNFNLLNENINPGPTSSKFNAVRMWDGVGAGIPGTGSGLWPAAGYDRVAVRNYVNTIRTNYPGKKIHLAVGVRSLNGVDVNTIYTYTQMLKDLKADCIANFGGNPFESFEIWNEPTTSPSAQSGITPAQAAAYTKNAFDVLKAWDPNIIITSPSITRSAAPDVINTTWFNSYVNDASNPSQYIDVWNVHRYGLTQSPTPGAEISALNYLADFKNRLNNIGEGGKPIWLTEGSNYNVTLYGTNNTSWAEEISYVRRSYMLSFACGFIDRIYFYAWDNAQSGTSFNMIFGGSLTQEGTDYNTVIYPFLNGATINSVAFSPDNSGNQWSGTWTIVYTRSAVQHTVSWVTTNNPPTVTLS